MLYAQPPKSSRIEAVYKDDNALYMQSEKGRYRLLPMTETCVRITYTERECFSTREKPGVIALPKKVRWEYAENPDKVMFTMHGLHIEVERENACFTYKDGSDVLLLRERKQDSREMEEFQTYRLADDESVKTRRIETADGVKEVVAEALRVPEEKLYHIRWNVEWQDGEVLYGLGQQEEGILNLRGQTVYVHQANRKIAIPMLLSTAGYGVLTDAYSSMIFNDTISGSYLYTEAAEEQDYYFIVGADMKKIMKTYRRLTGKAAMLPKWAFGYIQSQERYETAKELESVAKEYHERGIGLDAVVLDWCSWEDGMWGQKTMDVGRFPDPKGMIDALHEENVHFMISVWPNMDEHTDNYKEMNAADALLPASGIYNAFDEGARRLYWSQLNRGLFCHGVDAWWCDSSEPITVEWNHKVRREPSAIYCEYCAEAADHMPAWATNAYPLYHAQSIYEGQRSVTQQKRVCNLTRSAYIGQQRYGTILWSGDTAASWDTLRKQIVAGLSFVACGLPYWTVDIGAFFVKKSTAWYWNGEYDDTFNDAGYLELYTRWFQWAAFLPVFRGHGTDCRRELWYYQGENGMFYDAMLAANHLRYRLIPYIYSQAGRVWLEDELMMRPLTFDFPKDTAVYDIKDQYMFGDSLMVCPVTTPMYFLPGNCRIEGSSYERKVYLPAGCGWYDFYTGSFYEGGTWITAQAAIDRIPVYVRAGSIIPMTEAALHVSVKDEITWKVYAGADCEYTLYEDAGDGYGYEAGEYTLKRYYWSENECSLKDGEGNEIICEVCKR